MNNSTSALDNLPAWIQYAVFGSAATATNLFILFILLRNIEYFKKSAFITGLAVGDLIDGFALMVNGALRIKRTIDGTSTMTVHPSYCMKTMVIPIFLMGNQLPGVMFFLIGVERFLAVYRYNWYYINWSNKFAWMLTACVYMYCTLSVAVSFIVAFSYPESYSIGIICGANEVIGLTYSAYNYSLAVVGGSVAIVTTIVAMVIFTKRKNSLNTSNNVSVHVKFHVKNQWRLTKVSLCLAVVDFGFLVVPSFIIFLSNGFNVNFNINQVSLKTWSLQLVCFRSILNVIIYLFINSEFRAAALRAIGIRVADDHSLNSKTFTNAGVRIKPTT